MSADDGGVGLMLWGDRLTCEEKERMEVVLADLENVPQACPLINSINRGGGIQLETQPELFEARIAQELHSQGIQFDYEYKTGVGETSVDFRIGGEGDPEFLIEVVSLRTSKGVKEATYDQYPWFGLWMSSENLACEELKRQSEEAEIMTAQRKLGEKVYIFKEGRIVKFPEPQPKRFHIIVADVRGLTAPAPAGAVGIGIGDLRQAGDLSAITYGYWRVDWVDGHPVRLPVFVPQVSTNPPERSRQFRRLRGVFEEGADNPHIRERIHAIHFVCEKSFTPGEIITSASHVIGNPHLVSEECWAALANAYPLRGGSVRGGEKGTRKKRPIGGR